MSLDTKGLCLSPIKTNVPILRSISDSDRTEDRLGEFIFVNANWNIELAQSEAVGNGSVFETMGKPISGNLSRILRIMRAHLEDTDIRAGAIRKSGDSGVIAACQENLKSLRAYIILSTNLLEGSFPWSKRRRGTGPK